ncbi:MAG: extracellular solute-binding protein [Endomicrobiia bacterium]
MKKLFRLFFIFPLILSCAKKEQKNVLTLWHVGSEEEAQIIKNLADKYFTPESGISVVCESVSWSEAHTKYLTAIAGEVLPDLGTMGLTWASEFGYKGAMVELYERFPADVETLKKNIFKSIWESAELKGKVYGIPFDLTVQLLYYRSDIISKPPQTWQQLTEVLKNLNAQNKSMMIAWGSLDWIGFSPFLWQAGGDYYNKEGTKSIINSEEAKTALKFFADLYKKYNVPRSAENFGAGFRSGEYPLGMCGNWLINSFPYEMPELEGKWSIGLLPKGPSGKRTSFIGGRVIGIFKTSKNIDKAFEFIKFLSKPQIQKEIYIEVAKTKNIYLPPNVNIWKDLPIKEEFKKVLFEQIKEAKGPPSVLGWDDSTKYVVEAIQNVIVADKSVEEELKKCEEKLTQHIIK